jgi:hypothetical protein
MEFKSNHEEFIYLSGYVDGSRNQANLMYSEEDVLKVLSKFRELRLIEFQEWFEQFKK